MLAQLHQPGAFDFGDLLDALGCDGVLSDAPNCGGFVRRKTFPRPLTPRPLPSHHLSLQ